MNLTALSAVTPIASRPPQSLTHAKACQFLIPDAFGSDIASNILAQVEAETTDKENTRPLASSCSTSSQAVTVTTSVRPLKKLKAEASVGDEPHRWDSSRKQEFDRDFMKLLIATNTTWNFANNPEMCIFFSKWSDGAQVADWKVLSGQILDEEVSDVQQRVKRLVEGKDRMGQCDGWKNVAKRNVVSSMVTVNNEVS